MSCYCDIIEVFMRLSALALHRMMNDGTLESYCILARNLDMNRCTVLNSHGIKEITKDMHHLMIIIYL